MQHTVLLCRGRDGYFVGISTIAYDDSADETSAVTISSTVANPTLCSGMEKSNRLDSFWRIELVVFDSAQLIITFKKDYFLAYLQHIFGTAVPVEFTLLSYSFNNAYALKLT